MKENKYLSKEYTTCVKGICSIIIVIHHFYQRTWLFYGTPIGTLLGLSGALAVSMFFFYSGYGLMLSSKKKDYVRGFFRRRFLPLYCFYVMLIILHSFWTLWIGHTISLNQLVQSFFFGGTVVKYGWYMQATFVLYLMYLFSFSIFKSAKLQMLAMTLFIFVYCIYCRIVNLGMWWYQTVPCVILGMLYCYLKERIDVLLNKYAWIVFIASLITFELFYSIIIPYLGQPQLAAIYFLFFVCAMVSFSYIVCGTPILNNPLFALCGKYSLEIYVTHGLFMKLSINNKFVHIITIIVGTILMSAILKKIYAWLVSSLFRIKCCTHY